MDVNGRYTRVLMASFAAWLGIACASEPIVYLGERAQVGPVKPAPEDPAGSPAPTLPDASVAPIVTADAAGAPAARDPEPPPCQLDFADCDGERTNGCETDLQTSQQHCGRCGNACETPDCACVGGKLSVSCPSGRADCDGDRKNGCEVDTNSDLQHCGRCQHVCHLNGHDAVAAKCVAGQCHISCENEALPEVDCDHDPDNGCEARLWVDPENCGTCGKRCSSGMCNSGMCL